MNEIDFTEWTFISPAIVVVLVIRVRGREERRGLALLLLLLGVRPARRGGRRQQRGRGRRGRRRRRAVGQAGEHLGLECGRFRSGKIVTSLEQYGAELAGGVIIIFAHSNTMLSSAILFLSREEHLWKCVAKEHFGVPLQRKHLMLERNYDMPYSKQVPVVTITCHVPGDSILETCLGYATINAGFGAVIFLLADRRRAFSGLVDSQLLNPD